jgi:hypothetical protein
MLRFGGELKTLSIAPGSEYQAVVVPLVNDSGSQLYCPCRSTARSVIRSAVGEAIDLKRITGAAEVTLLLPSEPRGDVLEFIEYAGLNVDWPHDAGWHISPAQEPAYQQNPRTPSGHP